MVEKIRDTEVKDNLQSLFETWEINSRYIRDHILLVKKDKNNTNRQLRDGDNKDNDKAKSHNTSKKYK